MAKFLPTLFFLLFFVMSSCYEEDNNCDEGQILNTTINLCVVDVCAESTEKCVEGCLIFEKDILCQIPLEQSIQ